MKRALRKLSTAVVGTHHESAASAALRVSTLPNGVRVATDATPGHFVSAGVYIDAGSRFECARTSGSAHVIDRLAFKVCRVSSS